MERRLIPITLILIFVQFVGLLIEFGVIDPFGKNREAQDLNSQVGFVERKERQVRRRSSSSPLWEETEKYSPLWSHDSVLTLKESSARLNLKGGTQIDLSENTLVVLDPATTAEDAPLRLHFYRGELKALVKAGKQSIHTPRWIVEPTPGADLKIISSGDDKMEVEVSEGSAKVLPETSKEGAVANPDTTIELKSGERIEIQGTSVSSRSMKAENLDWKSGDHVRIYSHSEPVEVKLEWNGAATEVEWTAKNQEAVRIPALSSGDLVRQVPYGTYHARLKTKDGTESKTLKIEIWKASKHYLTMPLPRDRARTKQGLQFAWTANSLAESYRIRVGDRSGKTVVIDGQTQGESEVLVPSEEGNFWWRVEAIDPEGFVIPSHYSQEIDFLENPLDAPVLMGPSLRAPGSAK